MPPPASLVAAARRLWAGLAGGQRFEDGVTVDVAPQSQLCPDGFVGVVSIGAGVLATVPVPELAAPVRAALESVPVHEATTVAGFEAAFSPAFDAAVNPAFEVGDRLGPAALAYTDAERFRPAQPRDGWRVESVDAGAPSLSGFLAGFPAESVTDSWAEEVDESGLAHVTSPVSVLMDQDGAVIAASGWRTWPGNAAHLGVLTSPRARGQGAGRAAASAAVTNALAAGLLPQWRARVPASRRVATALGFAELGAQLSLQVTAVGRRRFR